MRDMEGKICYKSEKVRFAHINQNFEKKYIVFSNFIKIRAGNETRPTYCSKRY